VRRFLDDRRGLINLVQAQIMPARNIEENAACAIDRDI
jgi:hypothetical protein